MRLVIQRVSKASVSVGGEVISSIGRGLCVLVGIRESDTKEDLTWIANKLLKLRLFEDSGGKRWGAGVQEAQLEVLCISQFTLYYELKGNKPDYRHAMGSEAAKNYYEQFLSVLRQKYEPSKIKDGQFGAMMEVSLVNEGPVTVTLDSPENITGTKRGRQAAASANSASSENKEASNPQDAI